MSIYVSAPVIQVEQKFPLHVTGKVALNSWMRQRGRVAIANPIVLGGPVKPLVTVCQFSVALCAAFASGIVFILWLLLA